MNSVEFKDVRDLLDALLEGTISRESLQRLDTLAQSDAEVRHLLRAYLELDGFLRWECGDRLDASEAFSVIDVPRIPVTQAPRLPATPAARPPVVSFLGRASQAFQKPVFWSIFVVGLVFCGYFAALTWNLRNGTSPHGADRGGSGVALIVSTQGAQWNQSRSAIKNLKSERRDPHVSVSGGQPLAIDSGLVELHLKQGAILLIEGPAEWSINDDNAATLNYGKLLARVPQQAIGFSLDTPSARIVDLGTEFGVITDATGKTDVEVLHGQVAVLAGVDANQPASPRKLKSGEAVQVNGVAGVVSVPSNPSRFKTLASHANEPDDAKQSASVAFRQGSGNALVEGAYTGCSDAQLISWAANENHGKRDNFDVGNHTGPASSVLRFDLTALAGRFSRIISARLVLSQDQALAVRSPGSVQVHLLSKANRNWVEGSGRWSADSNQGATWNQLATGSRWAGAGGASKEGIDYDPRVVASRDYEARFSNKPFVFELEGDLSFLAEWAETPETNAGFILRNGTPAVRNNRISFYSSDFPDVAARPMLEIEYVPSDSHPVSGESNASRPGQLPRSSND